MFSRPFFPSVSPPRAISPSPCASLLRAPPAMPSACASSCAHPLHRARSRRAGVHASAARVMSLSCAPGYAPLRVLLSTLPSAWRALPSRGYSRSSGSGRGRAFSPLGVGEGGSALPSAARVAEVFSFPCGAGREGVFTLHPGGRWRDILSLRRGWRGAPPPQCGGGVSLSGDAGERGGGKGRREGENELAFWRSAR